jgi:hypothetical protein
MPQSGLYRHFTHVHASLVRISRARTGRAVSPPAHGGDDDLRDCAGPAPAKALLPLNQRLSSAAAAYLARFKGLSHEHTNSELRADLV